MPSTSKKVPIFKLKTAIHTNVFKQTWYKTLEKPESGSSVESELKIEPIKKEDQGWLCEAENWHGVITSVYELGKIPRFLFSGSECSLIIEEEDTQSDFYKLLEYIFCFSEAIEMVSQYCVQLTVTNNSSTSIYQTKHFIIYGLITNSDSESKMQLRMSECLPLPKITDPIIPNIPPNTTFSRQYLPTEDRILLYRKVRDDHLLGKIHNMFQNIFSLDSETLTFSEMEGDCFSNCDTSKTMGNTLQLLKEAQKMINSQKDSQKKHIYKGQLNLPDSKNKAVARKLSFPNGLSGLKQEAVKKMLGVRPIMPRFFNDPPMNSKSVKRGLSFEAHMKDWKNSEYSGLAAKMLFSNATKKCTNDLLQNEKKASGSNGKKNSISFRSENKKILCCAIKDIFNQIGLNKENSEYKLYFEHIIKGSIFILRKRWERQLLRYEELLPLVQHYIEFFDSMEEGGIGFHLSWK